MISIDSRLPAPAARKLIELQDTAHASLDASKAARFRMTQIKADDPAMAMLERRAVAESHTGEEMLALVNNIAQWLKNQSNVTFEMAPAVDAKPLDDETAQQAVQRLRVHAGTLRMELFETQNAPLPLASQKALVRAHVKELAARGAPRLIVTRDRAEAQFADPRRDFGFTEGYMASVMAWLWPDRMIEQLEAQLEAQQGAMSDTVRTKRLGEITAEIDDVSRQEESLIESAAAQGQNILRWPYSSSAAVLGIVVVQKQAAAA